VNVQQHAEKHRGHDLQLISVCSLYDLDV